MGLVIALGGFIGVIVFMVVMVKKTLAKVDAESAVAMDPTNIKTAQEFLPFDKIEDDLIDLGGFRYKKIIECTSINYHLKTEMEQEMIEASFARFLNSFQFPITFYIQTREIDMSGYLESLKNSIEEVCEEFPDLIDYGTNFYREMRSLPDMTGNSKQKKKYIIVGYDEAVFLENFTPEEKRAQSIQELNLRVQVLVDNLSGIGIKCNVLNTAGLLELMYSTYHKDDYSNFENLLTGEYTSLLTGFHIFRDDDTGRIIPYVNNNPVEKQDDLARTENALWNAKNIIKTEILNRDGLDEASQELYQAVIDRLDDLVEEMKDFLNGEENTLDDEGGDEDGIW